MRRFQQGLGLLIAIFALAGVLSLGGCKEKSTTEKMDEATEDAQDAANKAADDIEEAGEEAKDKIEEATNP